MGYYSTMEMGLEIKESMVEDFLEEVEKRKKEDCDLSNFFLADLSLDEDRGISFPEYFGKWYGDEEFAKFVAKYVEEGRLTFTGEDGEKWGYFFDGRGNVKLIEYIEKVLDKYFYREDGVKNKDKISKFRLISQRRREV